jgi:hypothetical protein
MIERHTEPQVFPGRWIGNQHQPGHAGFENQETGRLFPADFHHNPFPDAVDFENGLPHDSLSHAGQSGTDRNWFFAAANLLNGDNFPANGPQDSASHGFHFGKFWHFVLLI